MITSRFATLPLIAIAILATVAALPSIASLPRDAEARMCTIVPGSTVALVRVERDTTLPFITVGAEMMSSSSVRPSPYDSLLATPNTPMPAARVRLLQLDSTTRDILAGAGVTDGQPVAFIKAAPYRADCRAIRWTDTIPFVVRGEVGYVRGMLAPRAQWIDGVPLLVVRDAWNYPYPRRRYVAYGAAPDAPLASAEALFSLNALLEIPRPTDASSRTAADSVRRARALAWARANGAAAELEPVRTLVRRAVLEPDWNVASATPSRLRGSYRVTVEVGGESSTWFFRTYSRPLGPWRGADSLQTTADMLASPHIGGYMLGGIAAPSQDSLLLEAPRGFSLARLVSLAAADRPTTPNNDARRELSGMLQFALSSAPERLWNELETFVPRLTPRDSAAFVRMNIPNPRGVQQARIPLTVRLDGRGVRADTTLTIVGGRTLRVVLERIDTLVIRRPY